MILQAAKVATPLALVVAVVVGVQEKPGLPVTVSTTESPERGLPNASTTVTDGCCAKLTPARVGPGDGCVENVAVAAAAGVMLNVLLGGVVVRPLLVAVRV